MAVNRREKVLAVVVAGLVAAFILQVIIKGVFLSPLAETAEKIDKLRESIATSRNKMAGKEELIRQWAEAYKLMIAEDANAAANKLSSRISTLATLAELKDTRLKPHTITIERHLRVDSYYSVAVSLSCKGTLAQVVGFLEMLDQEPYLIKVKGFTLNSQGTGKVLSFRSRRIEAIVLVDPILRKAVPDGGRSVPDPLPEPLTTDQYARIAEKDILHQPEEPVAAELPRPNLPEEIHTPHERKWPGWVGRQVGDGNLVGVVSASKDGGIYLRNSDGTQWYKLGDEVNGLVLEFVHPLGAVLRTAAGDYRYVQIGTSVDQARPLQADDQVGEQLLMRFETWRSAKSVGQ